MRHELETQTKSKLKDIALSEHLGQHLLVNEDCLGMVVNQIGGGSSVLEIGSGPGNLTERIASRANKVVGIEIDQRFQPFLDGVQSTHRNVDIIYKDAISVDFAKIFKNGPSKEPWQMVSNLPFHISEAFLKKIINLPVEDVTLIVGDQLARKMQIDNPGNLEFSKTSLLTQTFFEFSFLTHIEKSSFYPQPRTDACLITLYPRDKREFESNPGKAIMRNMFLSEKRNPTVINVIKESIGSGRNRPTLSKTENHRLERRRLKQEMRQLARGLQPDSRKKHGRNQTLLGLEVDKLALPKDILDKPFSRLDNQDIKMLASAISRRYG